MARAFLRFVDRSFGKYLVRAVAAYEGMRTALGGGRGRPAPGDGPGSRPLNILVIKLVGLGDTVLMLTPLAHLRRRFPDARITALMTPLSAGILSVQPSVDETVLYDVFGKDRGVGGILRIVRLLRDRKFDCVIDFEQHFHLTSILAYLTGAPRRLGFYFNGSPRRRIFTDPVHINPDQHMVESYMDLIGPLGISRARVEELERIRIPAGDAEYAGNWLENHGVGQEDLLVGIHAGSGPRAPAKRWGIEKYAEVVRRLRDDLGAKVVLTGSRDERDLAAGVIELAGGEGVFNSSGELSIRQTAALLARCRLFISNDTGPMHLAAALGTRTIGLFGPETPIRYGPVGKANRAVYAGIHCSPCVHIYAGVVNDCAEGICMGAIEADDVWDAVLKSGVGG